MKKGILFFVLILLYHNVKAQNIITGHITNINTGETLPGVSIYFPDLKIGATSDIDGNYKIDKLPASKILVQVSFVGYKSITEAIDLSSSKTKDFALEESILEMSEVVVTGMSVSGEKNRNPSPIQTIQPIELMQSSSTNIIDALAKQPGVSQITTGSGISKPIIRGMGYNRVVTLSDGVKQEGQQWGDEHGIEIDEFSVSKVEILKGPASLAYGSNAMAGVINMLSAPTLPEGNINANILTNYQTNNGLIAYSAHFAGNKKGIIWEIRYSNKMAHSYQNRFDGYVLNSGFRENAGSALIGINKSWGYSHLLFNAYNLTPGIVEGERDSITGKFIKPIALTDSTSDMTIASQSELKSYSAINPYQKIHHYKTVWNSNIILGDGSLKTTFGWQINQRQEYGDVLQPNTYGLYFRLNTGTYNIQYTLPEFQNYNLSFGVNGMYQNSQNLGTEYLVPAYSLFDYGFFAIAKKSLGNVDISGGLRYDARSENGEDLYLSPNGEKADVPSTDTFHRFNAFKSKFTGITGSLGVTYQFLETYYTKFNVARGFRGPDIGEIGANGVHDGTIRYEIGDPNLKAEYSMQADYALGLNTEHVSAELNLFSSAISNYIFLHKLESTLGGDSINQGYSTFKYVAGDANLLGGEFSLDLHPHPFDWLHFENAISYVQSTQKNQPDSSKYLPNTPPLKITTELRATARKMGKTLANGYLSVGMENYFAQNKFYSAYGTETATPSYTLFEFGLGADVVHKSKTLFSLYLSATNLTNVGYQSHLSRLKYAPINYATQRTGVFNMGRNISLKLLIPLDFSKKRVG